MADNAGNGSTGGNGAGADRGGMDRAGMGSAGVDSDGRGPGGTGSAAGDAAARGEEVFRELAPDGAAPPWDGLADLAPALGAEVRHLLGSVMGRPGLDLRTREIATICMLATLGGCEPQLAFHIGGALRAGAKPGEVIEALTQVSLYAGVPRALNAMQVARQAFAAEGIWPLPPVPATTG